MNWNFKKLLIPPLIAMILFLSWLSPWTRPFWDQVDQYCFETLNSWVQQSPFWQNFWAFMGHRAMDWIHDGIMFLFFFISIKKASEAFKARKIAQLLLTIFIITITITIVNSTSLPEIFNLQRHSPTKVDHTAFRLSSVIEWTNVKDHSSKSFPGDHGITAILFASLIYHLMGWRIGLLATLYAIFFCLPRLIVGAHWLTDILKGSSLIAITISSFIMGSPLAASLLNFFERIVQKYTRKRKVEEYDDAVRITSKN